MRTRRPRRRRPRARVRTSRRPTGARRERPRPAPQMSSRPLPYAPWHLPERLAQRGRGYHGPGLAAGRVAREPQVPVRQNLPDAILSAGGNHGLMREKETAYLLDRFIQQILWL